MKIQDLLEDKKWTISDIEIDKVNDYVEVSSSDEYHTMANEQWSDKFTYDDFDSGKFDEFIEYAYARHQRDRGKK